MTHIQKSLNFFDTEENETSLIKGDYSTLSFKLRLILNLKFTRQKSKQDLYKH